ncbi:DUF1456 family protein [Flavobacterium sp.]|uniref:DUF1456 family protein n=1 Tax=Flavobacterium sp. TaxID=239 RepID=UPI0026344560|nr:DUF1456 family protein [Flavobacterium sp.]
MTNNDIFKKLRVALKLRDEHIVEILQLVDFRITKSELSAFFRDEKHPNYVECGDQIIRNFLNGLVLFLRGSKEQPKQPSDVLRDIHKDFLEAQTQKTPAAPVKRAAQKPAAKKAVPKKSVVEKVAYKNGKKK